LQKKKAYFDYDKQLRDQNKEIAILEAQSRALVDVTDAESKALKARIDAQIKQKREEQSDTIRDHSVQLQTEGLTDLQTKLQENYDKWSHGFEADSAQQLDVMRSTNLTTDQMATTMDNLLSTFGTNMSQMGVQVATVNAATSDAVYAVNGRFNAFTGNDTIYSAAVRSNADMQNKMVSSLSGPVSDVMNNKLASTWTYLTSGGEATMIDILDYTSDMIDDHLIYLDEMVANLPDELEDPLNGISDSIDAAVGEITDFEAQAVYTIQGSIVGTTSAVIGAGTMIAGSLGAVNKAIGLAASTIIEKMAQMNGYDTGGGSE